jgi:serine protease Do
MFPKRPFRRSLVPLLGSVFLAALLGPTPEAAPKPPPGANPIALGNAFADLAARVGPTTVHIESRHESSVSTGLDQLSRDFAFTLPQQKESEESDGPRSTGSGVIIDASGLVLTNHHVVGDSRTVTVTLHDKRSFPADVVGSDSRTDIAVLQLKARPDDGPFPTAAIGNSDAIRVGEWVMAVGHPFDFQFSVTVGILSARGRRDLSHDEIQDYLQTDAAVNPGSSGGPLFNMHGELVGINTAIFNPGQTAQNAGIAFAIPSNMATRVAGELRQTGRVARATLGVEAETRPPSTDNPRPGAELMRIFPDTPAEKAGLRRGDVVIAVDGEPVGSEKELRSVILARGVGAVLTIRIERANKTLDIQVQTRAARDVDLPGLDLPRDAKEWAGLVLTPPTPGRMAQLGVTPPEDERFRGLLVLSVAPASAGSAAGLVVGDILLTVAGTPVEDPSQLDTILDGKRSAAITFWRDGSMATAAVAGLERREK